MQDLERLLGLILDGLEQLKPRVFNMLQPGLSHTEIDALTSELPFVISNEVYILYEWRNGVEQDDLSWISLPDLMMFIDKWTFIPLQFSIELLSRMSEANEDLDIDSRIPFILPIFYELHEETYLGLLAGQEDCAVFQVDLVEAVSPRLVYENLNTMLTIFARDSGIEIPEY